jgi:hypothetical protein
MRKLFAACVAILLCCSATFAQSMKSKPYFGVKAGLNLSTFRGAVDYANYDAKIKVGGVVGGFVGIPLSSKFALQPEFLYSQMGARAFDDNWGKKTLYYNFFSIPVLVKFKMFEKWNLVGGPQFDFLIRARQKDYLDRKTTITNDIKDFDFAYTIGFETWLSRNVVVGARYIHGSQDVSTTSDNNTLFNQAVQATVGWRLFKHVKTKKVKK